jgi:hypothetical protein
MGTHVDKKDGLFKACGAMTEQGNEEHMMACRKLAKFFEVGGSNDCSVAAAKSAQDLFAWLLHWLPSAQLDVKPMWRHEEPKEVLKSSKDDMKRNFQH